jgi:carbon monoxide dehydrogenase subunit G
MSMDLDHSFTVPVAPDRAWDVLLDVERIAPCMPGATVEEFDGEVVTGRIKVKVGPVSLTYRGTAKFTERDPGTRVVVVDASGKETRGAGTASAAIRATLEPSGEGTQVLIHTSMNVTGRPAQFGRGVIAEVGGKLVEKFSQNLAQMISDGGQAAAAVDGAVVDGAVVDGVAVDGVAVDGVAVDGVAVDGVAVDGVAVDGVAGDDATMVDLPVVDTSAADDATMVDLPVVDSAAVDSAGLGSAGIDSVEGDGTAGDGTAGDAGTTGTGPGSTRPVAVVRPAVSTPAAPAPAPAHHEDSINLVRLVGPAILKRLLPIAAAAAIVALLGRRFRNSRRSRKS